MPDLATSNITGQLVAVLREAIEGPQHSWTYFTDNQPGTGLFGTIGPLSPADVSRPQGKSGTTIAGHVHHLAFCLPRLGGLDPRRATAVELGRELAGPHRRQQRMG